MDPMNNTLSEKTEKTILYLLLAIGSAAYLSLIFNNNLWVDEAFTACIIRCPWGEAVRRTAEDTLPPFYNLFTKLLTVLLGYSAPVMKLSSVLPMILSMVLAVTLVRKRFGFRKAFLLCLFLFSMPHLLFYGVEIRTYSWGLFFALGAGIFFCEVFRTGSKKSWILFAVFTALCGYTHHFAFVSAGILWFFLLLFSLFHRILPESRVKLSSWAASLCLTFLLYFPGLLLTVRQIRHANSYFSMAPLSLHTLPGDLRFPFVTNFTPLSALLLLFFLIGAARAVYLLCVRGEAGRTVRLPALCLLLDLPCTLIFGYGVSFLMGSSLFTARYLVPALGLFWLGAALAAEEDRLTVSFWTALALAAFLFTYTAQFRSEYAPGVKEMTAFFDSELGEGDGYVIYEDSYQIELCFRYYYPDLKKYSWKNVDEIPGTVWYFEVEGYEEELKKAAEHGFETVDMGEMAFDRYRFHLYRLEKKDL